MAKNFSVKHKLMLATLLALALLWSVLAWQHQRVQAQALREIERDTAALARLFAQHTANTFRNVDHALHELRQTWVKQPSDMGDSVQEYRALLGSAVLQVAVIGADGYLAYSDLGMPKAPLLLAEREHFNVHQGRQIDQLFISRPLRGKVSGKWSIQFTRPIFARFRQVGVVVLSVDPNYFVGLFQQSDLGARGEARMVRDSGEIMARSAEQARFIAQVTQTTPYLGAGLPQQGSFRRNSIEDGVDRLSSYVRLPQYGVTLIVSPSVEERLRPVRVYQRNMILGALLLSLTVLVLAWHSLRSLARNTASRTALDASHAALQRSEARFRSYLENAAEVIFQLDLQARLVYVSPSWHKTLGHDSAAVLGQGLASFVAPDDWARWAVVMNELVAANAKPAELQFRMAHNDGSWHWYGASAAALLDPQQTSAGVLAVARDITRDKQSQLQLQLVARVFSAAHEAIMIADVDGNFLDVNDSFCRITGYRRDEVVGKNPRLLHSGRHAPEFYASLWQTLHAQGYWSGEIWNRRKNGEIYPELLSISALRDQQGRLQSYLGMFSDITALKEHQQQLEQMAHFDALTGLPNRVLLGDRLHQALTQCQRRHLMLAVVYLDLDGFKQVNDQYGHSTGDTLLVGVAQRMKEALREGDTLARMGGDEFVAVLVDLSAVADCHPVLERLQQAAAQPLMVAQTLHQVSASMGVALFPQDGGDADLLLRQADQTMYLAKNGGKNRFQFYDLKSAQAHQRKCEELEALHQALDAQQFVLYYQPKVNMKTGAVLGVEALIRWQHPERGLLAPGLFLPVLEGQTLSLALGDWVLAQALAQAARWNAAGWHLQISVNIAALQLQHSGFVARLAELLAAQPSVDAAQLELEILETSSLADLAQVCALMQRARALGVGFALDDFGTGYSSLSYLKQLPAALLKIDQSFVRNMLSDSGDLSIVQGIIGLARAFHREVIAEGVETAAHGAKLMELGCALAQGYGVARPMPAAELPAWIARWQLEPVWTA